VKVYRVGGSVRDELLGRPIADRDYVVVGATPEAMIARGYRPIGRDFPVFLHPDTREEYALARTERKRGRGHRGFVFHAAPDVTLEEDLARRDLTINAMARDAGGALIDPYGGAADLERRILRHVGAAFVEDPLRVLRVARFAARLGFAVAPETAALMRSISESGELETLAPERVWQELARALMEAQPSAFFLLLRRCGALAQLLPEVDAQFAPHAGGAARRMLRALDAAARAQRPLAVRYAVVAGNLAPENIARGARLAEGLSARLRAPAECRDLAVLAARHRGKLERTRELDAAGLLDLLLATDALRRPGRLDGLLEVCAAFASGRGSRAGTGYAPAERLHAALERVRGVEAGALARQVAPAELPRRLRALRLKALRDGLAPKRRRQK